MRSAGNFIIGLLLGAALGAAAGLLFAPMSGEQLRNEAGRRANELGDNIRSTVEQERRRLEDEFAALKRGEMNAS